MKKVSWDKKKHVYTDGLVYKLQKVPGEEAREKLLYSARSS